MYITSRRDEYLCLCIKDITTVFVILLQLELSIISLYLRRGSFEYIQLYQLVANHYLKWSYEKQSWLFASSWSVRIYSFICLFSKLLIIQELITIVNRLHDLALDQRSQRQQQRSREGEHLITLLFVAISTTTAHRHPPPLPFCQLPGQSLQSDGLFQ